MRNGQIKVGEEYAYRPHNRSDVYRCTVRAKGEFTCTVEYDHNSYSITVGPDEKNMKVVEVRYSSLLSPWGEYAPYVAERAEHVEATRMRRVANIGRLQDISDLLGIQLSTSSINRAWSADATVEISLDLLATKAREIMEAKAAPPKRGPGRPKKTETPEPPRTPDTEPDGGEDDTPPVDEE